MSRSQGPCQLNRLRTYKVHKLNFDVSSWFWNFLLGRRWPSRKWHRWFPRFPGEFHSRRPKFKKEFRQSLLPLAFFFYLTSCFPSLSKGYPGNRGDPGANVSLSLSFLYSWYSGMPYLLPTQVESIKH